MQKGKGGFLCAAPRCLFLCCFVFVRSRGHPPGVLTIIFLEKKRELPCFYIFLEFKFFVMEHVSMFWGFSNLNQMRKKRGEGVSKVTLENDHDTCGSIDFEDRGVTKRVGPLRSQLAIGRVPVSGHHHPHQRDLSSDLRFLDFVATHD